MGGREVSSRVDPRGVRLRPPGILSLGRFVVEHFERLEADFRTFYGLTLAEALWGRDAISGRYLRSLVSSLPLTGAVGHALDDPRATGWGNTEELLAALIETVDSGNRLYFRANTKRGTRQPDPITVPRPERKTGETEDVSRPRKRQATPEEMRAFFGGSVRYTGPSVEDVDASSGNPVSDAAARPRDARGRFVKVAKTEIAE